MMISFSDIGYLSRQHDFIQKKLKTKSAVFLVGGCIRNLLLKIENNPKDIDITLAGDPKEIYDNSNKAGLSHFMTEKFGTITFIKKGKSKNSEIKYEITPLRTESGYEDFRHPGEINWSNDIILDSQRRDFTINSLYFFADKSAKKPTKKNIDINPKQFIDGLKRDGVFGIAGSNILIIQDHEIIKKIFKDGIYQKENLAAVVQKYKLGNESDYCYFIIDPNKGIQDLFDKKLRAVGDENNRFQEDALRLLRGLRFVNVINHQLKIKKPGATLFDFDKPTWNAIKRKHTLIANIAKERIKDELVKVFCKGDPFGFVALLDESGLLRFIFPSLYHTRFIDQPVRFHPFDVYTHTLLTLYELQKINSDYLVRFGMLYHDVGKVAQFSAYKDELSKEEIREILSGPLNHRKGGPELVRTDFLALGFSKKEVDQIARYVANHHKPEEILDGENDDNIKKKMRKFLSEAGYKQVQNILDITIADRRGQYNPLQNNSDLQEITYLRKLLKQIQDEEGQFTMKQLDLDGQGIIEYFGIPPSKLIGELLNQALDWVLGDVKSRNNKEEILKYLTGYIKNKNIETIG